MRKRQAAADEIMRSDIPFAKMIYELTKPGVLDRSEIRAWLARTVDRALDRMRSPDARSRAVALALKSEASGEAQDWDGLHLNARRACPPFPTCATHAAVAASLAAGFAKVNDHSLASSYAWHSLKAAAASAASATDKAAEYSSQIADLRDIISKEGLE